MFSSRPSLKVIIASCLLVSVLGTQQLIRTYLYQHAEIKEAPYLVQLRRDNGEFYCAGALLNANYVLTAAECFDNEDFTKSVVVGAASKLDDAGVQRQIEKVIKHPAYTSATKHSNAAVLKLKEPMESSSFRFVYPYLPKESISNDVHPNTYGWRHFVQLTNEERTLYLLRYSVSAQDDCLSKFNASDESNIFCIEGDDYDGHYCVEDLGSPTVYRRKLIGIATAAQNCKTPGYHVSYTNVYNIKSFIEEAMK